MLEALKAVISPIHKEGYVFVAIGIFAALVFFALYTPLGYVSMIFALACALFFRDPERVTPIDDKLVIAPADGFVQNIKKVKPPIEMELGEDKLTRVSIFLSVLDVHVNRIPVTGKVSLLSYREGKFINASLDKASEDNERQIVVVDTKHKSKVGFSQIAGLIARRIVCDLSESQQVKSGERFGIIRFGSRMDVYLPKGVEPLVFKGQTIIGGETILANLVDKGEERKAEVRK